MAELPVSFNDLKKAQERIADTLKKTYLSKSVAFSKALGKEIYFKWDNTLRTGSFKERGALNFLKTLSKKDGEKGVLAASLGNHAQAVAYHASKLGLKCKIFMPINAPLVKVKSTQRFGAEVCLDGDTFGDAKRIALEASKNGAGVFVPTFDHPEIIAGQGVAGLEVCEQLSEFDAVVVPVGGGGYISGIATAVKELAPKSKVVGVQSVWAETARSKGSGAVVNKVSIADGIAVKQIGKLTGQIIDALVDGMITVSDDQIARALLQMLEREHVLIEGAAAAGIAAIQSDDFPQKLEKVVVMICGSNIDLNMVGRLINRHQAQQGRHVKVSVSLPDRPGSLKSVVDLLAEARANVISVHHNRYYAELPGHVQIEIELEVRDEDHKNVVIGSLKEKGLLS